MSASIGQSIEEAKRHLLEGRLVAVPTETVYGLGANALDGKAVAGIFEAKNRPQFDPLIVHVSSLENAAELLEEIPPAASTLAKKFWPGPLTILLPKRPVIPDLVTAGLGRVGLRNPDHPLTQQLLQALPFPLAAPSANPFGYVSPTTAQHVNDQLGSKISYILDGGPCRIGIESTIIGWENGDAVIYRLGGLSTEVIEEAIGPVRIQNHSSSRPEAPGQLLRHYAPKKKFFLGDIDTLLHSVKPKNPGILSFQKRTVPSPSFHQALSEKGDLQEAAKNLFTMLREFDRHNIDCVIAEEVPNRGLGRAINDRLRRAASPEH